jgi:aspartyl-tRNA(Asn)/glutamyl-tRNA(Gln) amidotransferase subunit C
MKLDAAQVEKIALLARLQLKPEEIETLSSQLSNILDYVDELSQLDTKDIPPTAHVGPVSTPLREDIPHKTLDVESALRNAPDRRGSAFRVPKIIE